VFATTPCRGLSLSRQMVKSLVIAAFSLAVGIVAGWFLHARIGDPYSQIRASMQRSIAGSCHASVVSLAALLALERGDSDAAKRQLARQIASYHHTFGAYDGALPDCPKLEPMIASAAEQSPILRRTLAKKESQ
jgi:hypothetical protein